MSEEIWRPVFVLFTHPHHEVHSYPALHQSCTTAGHQLTPVTCRHQSCGPCVLYRLSHGRILLVTGKQKLTPTWKLPRPSELFLKRRSLTSLVQGSSSPCPLSVFALWIQQHALLSALGPWVFLQQKDLWGGGWLIPLLYDRLTASWASLRLAGSCWLVRGGNALHLLEQTNQVPLAKDLTEPELFYNCKMVPN